MNASRLVLLITLGLLMLHAPAAAQPRGPNVLVVSEDADPDTVPRNHRIFNQVFEAITSQLIARGFHVIDEPSVGLEITDPNRVRRRDSELIEVARAFDRPPIDVLVIFQIYASVKAGRFSDIARPRIRVAGRMLTIRGNQRLGSFESGDDLEFPPLPRNCDRECLLERVGAEAKLVGTSVGAALAAQLAAYLHADVDPNPGSPSNALPVEEVTTFRGR
jgi:hypothetical protein